MDHFHIELPCRLHYRDAAGALIGQICEGLEERGAERALRHQVVSAFNEAFNNLAQHCQAGAVRIDLDVSPEALVIEMRDRGLPFDYKEVPPPDLDELPESGLGVFIMRSFMTTVDYRPAQSGGQENVLRMVRRLRAGGQQSRGSTSHA